jgi:hypothetical protein
VETTVIAPGAQVVVVVTTRRTRFFTVRTGLGAAFFT